MKRIYALFLRLHPREYRDLFGSEVLAVFAEAAAEQRSRGHAVWLWFLIVELSAAVVSAVRHWIDRFSARPRVQIAGASRTQLFGAVAEAQQRVDLNLKRMTQAIASGDYLAARKYSVEDLKARDELRRLRDHYGFDDDETVLQ
ncbi:MAG TPA: hypothetical protein VHY84_27910 [Bryobacteraceae bacterium]|jgi:hypothetical protein|nr:hypothetical protein [Bryobacteraceae bacterium]